MNGQNAYFTILHPHPHNPVLSFTKKMIGNKETTWMSYIKIRNDNNQYLGFKVMSTVSELIKSYPFAGLLKSGETKTIKLTTKEAIFDKVVKVRILSVVIDRPQEIKDQYEVTDQFKLAENQGQDIHSITLQVADFIQSETVSYITLPSDKRISQVSPLVSQVQDGFLTPGSQIAKSNISQKRIKESMFISSQYFADQSIQLLQDQQENLINETRELNKQIVLFKAKQNIPFEEVKEGQVKFTLFQLIVIAIISIIVGFCLPDF